MSSPDARSKLIKSDPELFQPDYFRRCVFPRIPEPVTAKKAAKLPHASVVEVRGKTYSCANNAANPAAMLMKKGKQGELAPCCRPKTSAKRMSRRRVSRKRA